LASESGKKFGKFCTPPQLSAILSSIVTLNCQSPDQATKKPLKKVSRFAELGGLQNLEVIHKFLK
jgi:type I restriction enzyme M protein